MREKFSKDVEKVGEVTECIPFAACPVLPEKTGDKVSGNFRLTLNPVNEQVGLCFFLARVSLR